MSVRFIRQQSDQEEAEATQAFEHIGRVVRILQGPALPGKAGREECELYVAGGFLYLAEPLRRERLLLKIGVAVTLACLAIYVVGQLFFPEESHEDLGTVLSVLGTIGVLVTGWQLSLEARVVHHLGEIEERVTTGTAQKHALASVRMIEQISRTPRWLGMKVVLDLSGEQIELEVPNKVWRKMPQTLMAACGVGVRTSVQ